MENVIRVIDYVSLLYGRDCRFSVITCGAMAAKAVKCETGNECKVSPTVLGESFLIILLNRDDLEKGP